MGTVLRDLNDKGMVKVKFPKLVCSWKVQEPGCSPQQGVQMENEMGTR